MYTLGLTGGSGSGKGWCSEIFARYGIASLDTDKVARAVCEPGKPCLGELSAAFGPDIIRADGTLDRPLLARTAFSSPEKTLLLNSVTHKYILAECETWLKCRRDEGDFAAIIDVPQLYESRFNYRCDFCIAVVADDATRLRRILRRDSITPEAATQRMRAQHDNEYFRRRADFTIYNNSTDHPELQIDLILQMLRFV